MGRGKENLKGFKMTYTFLKFSVLVASISLLSCAKPAGEEPAAASSGGSSSSGRYLYVASGSCYSGGGITAITQAKATNKVMRYDLDTGTTELKIADYFDTKSQTGDTPVGLARADANNIYVAVQNATAGLRRVEKIPKSFDPTRSLVTSNSTALSATLRSLDITASGDLLVSKSSAIERISGADFSRVTSGANPYVNAPAAPCATSTTLISRAGVLSNQMIYFAHAATSQNRIAFVKASGYSIAGDCPVAQSAPHASAFPTATAYDQTNQILLVAYGGSTVAPDVNSIYAYKLNVTSNSVSIASANKIYDHQDFPATYSFRLYGISAMALDTTNNHLYVASIPTNINNPTQYKIEKLAYDPTKVAVTNNQVLTQYGGTTFKAANSDLKCVTDMIISD